MADDVVLSEVHVGSCPSGRQQWSTRFYYNQGRSQPYYRDKHAQSPDTTTNSACTEATSINDKPEGHHAKRHKLTSEAAAEQPQRGRCQAHQHVSNALMNSPKDVNHITAADDSQDDDDGGSVDSDGDIICRRPQQQLSYIQLEHHLATPLPDVGLQVWRGACLLSDYMLHKQDVIRGRHVLDLGAGVGLSSIMAARLGAQVQLTDHCATVLQLAQRNAAANAVGGATAALQLDWTKFLFLPHRQASLEVLAEFLSVQQDCKQQAGLLHRGAAAAGAAGTIGDDEGTQHQATTSAAGTATAQQQAEQQGASFGWCASDVQQLLRTDVLLAADTVYDEHLTEAFLCCAAYIMACIRLAKQQASGTPALHGRQQQEQSQQQEHGDGQKCSHSSADTAGAGGAGGSTAGSTGPVLLLAMEKRYNFTLRECEERAPAFDHLMRFLVEEGYHQQQQQQQPEEEGRGQQLPQPQPGPQPGSSSSSSSSAMFRYREVPLHEVPQAMRYERTSDLVLLELSLLPG